MDMNIKQIQDMENEIFKEVVRVCNQHDLHYYAAYGTVLGAVRHGGCIPWDDDVDIYIPENELDRFLDVMNKELDKKFWVDFRTLKGQYRDFPRIGMTGYDTEILHVDVFRLAGAPSDRRKQKRLRWISGRIHLLNNIKRKGINSYKGKKRMKAAVLTFLTALIPLKLTVRMVDYYSKKYPYETAKLVGSSASKSTASIIPKDYLGKGVIVDYEDFQIRIPERYEEYLSHMYGEYNKLPEIEIRNTALNRFYHTRTNGSGLIHIYYDT